MADINFGIDKLSPNCQNLIILNTTHGPPINFNQFFEEQIEISYFYPLNETTQLLMLPIKDNTKSDLVRDYTFKYFARQCPNAKIQIVYLIQSNLIDNIDTILLNDFSNLPNSNGLLIFFYDTPNEMVEWDQFKILKLI